MSKNLPQKPKIRHIQIRVPISLYDRVERLRKVLKFNQQSFGELALIEMCDLVAQSVKDEKAAA